LVGKSAFLNAKALQAETASLSILSDEEPPFDASIKLRFQQAIESYSKAIARLGHSRAMIGLAGVYLEYALYEHKQFSNLREKADKKFEEAIEGTYLPPALTPFCNRIAIKS